MTPSRPFSHRADALILFLSLALLASFAVNALLYRTAKRFYARELSVRLQPVGEIPIMRTGNPALPHVLFLGDSRAAEWPALPADRFYTLNAGIGGETTAQIRLRTEAILLAEKPAVVVLQAGINDLKSIGNLPVSADQIQSQCLANLVEIVKLCRQHNARVVLTLIFPTGKVPFTRRLVWSNEIEPAVNNVNQSLARQFASANGIAVLDCSKLLAPDHSDYRDTLHLKPTAYDKINAALFPLLNEPSKPTP